MPESRHIPRLMLVSDRQRSRRPLAVLAAEAVAGGADTLQLREPDLSDGELTAIVQEIKALRGAASIVVNGNVTVAKLLGIGVHLPERGPDPSVARDRLGPTALIGRSVHSPDAAKASRVADYLLAGHVYPTPSKDGLPPLGLDGLRAIVDASPVPVLAIGGITPGNAAAVMASGAHGIAAISAFAAADDPAAVARDFLAAMGSMGAQMDDATEARATITVNGRPADVAFGATVADFLQERGFQSRLVVVELNGTILKRDLFATQRLSAGDQLEVVHFVGGG